MQLTRVQAFLIHFLMIHTSGLTVSNTNFAFSDDEDVEVLQANQSYMDKSLKDAIASEVNTWKMEIFKNIKKNGFSSEYTDVNPEKLIPFLHTLGLWLHAIDALEEHKAMPTVIAAQYNVLPQMVAESMKTVGTIEEIITGIMERAQSDYRAGAINQVNTNVRRALKYLELPDETEKTRTDAWGILYRYMRPSDAEITKKSKIGLELWLTGNCNEDLLQLTQRFEVKILTQRSMEERIEQLVSDADHAAQDVANNLADSGALDRLLENDFQYCNAAVANGLYQEMQSVVTDAIRDAVSYISFDRIFLEMDELSDDTKLGELYGFEYEENLNMAQVVDSVRAFFGDDFEIEDIDLADIDIDDEYLRDDTESIYYQFSKQ